MVNHKKYIGLTNNLRRRRNRHFTDLRCHRHQNSFLQEEADLYGLENFSFEKIFEGQVTPEEIGIKEVEYIAFYDSYYNGYNQNKGGNFGPSNGGSHLVRSDIYSICSALEFCSRPGAILAELFGVTTTTISRIKHKASHSQVIEDYYSLPLEERQEIYKIFCDSVDFENKKKHQTIVVSKRKLTKEQAYLIFANDEFQIMTKMNLARYLGLKDDNVIYNALRHVTYQDSWYDYQRLTDEQKQELVSLLRNQ